MENIKVSHEYFKDVDLTTEEGRIKHIKGLYAEAGHHLTKWYKYQNRNALATVGTYVKCINYLLEGTTLNEDFLKRIQDELIKPFEASKYKIYE